MVSESEGYLNCNSVSKDPKFSIREPKLLPINTMEEWGSISTSGSFFSEQLSIRTNENRTMNDERVNSVRVAFIRVKLLAG
ncbi:MAG: hypothetical protein WBB24_14285, partial [Maribacter sp.]